MLPRPVTPARILIVDDQPANLLALEGLVRREGREVLLAGDGKEALELLLQTPDVAVALIDVSMPGMDGFELAELMRGAAATRAIPIIFLSAGARDGERVFRGYEAGAVDFLFRPFDLHVLTSKVDVFLELHARRQHVAWQRELLETVVENTHTAVLLLDAGGRVAFANSAATLLLGGPSGTLDGVALHDRLHPACDGSPACSLARLVAAETRIAGQVERLRAPDGSERVLACNARRVHEGDARAAVVVELRDVTEEIGLSQLAERARAEAETSRELLERVQGIVDATAGGMPLDALLAELLGLVQRTLRADTATVLLLPLDDDDADAARDVLRVRASIGLDAQAGDDVRIPVGAGFAGRIAATGRRVVMDELDHSGVLGRMPARRGVRSLAGVPLRTEERIVGVLHVGSLAPRRWRGEELALLELAADRIALAVTRAAAGRAQSRALAQLEAASRAKDEFLAVLSHELRSPLSAMLGWATLMRSGHLPREKLVEAAARIERNVRMLTELVNDLLDVSRIVSGKLAIEREPVALDAVVVAATDAVRPQAKERGVRLQVATQPLDAVVRGDAGRLHQVVLNLVGNAVKFTPRGGTVDVTLRRDGAEAELAVRDTGAGIDPGFLPHVFDRFTQAEGAATRLHGGLGLGLSIVRYLVQEHGGSVRAASPGRGGGATFTVRLPLELHEQRVLFPRSAARAAAARPTLDDVHVLVVDDEPDTREAIRLIIEAAGAVAVGAATAREALTLVAQRRPDLVVTDLGMPERDGYWLLEELQRRDETRGVPVVALTGFASRQDEARTREAGFARHIAKPVDGDALAATLAALVAARRDAGGDGDRPAAVPRLAR